MRYQNAIININNQTGYKLRITAPYFSSTPDNIWSYDLCQNLLTDLNNMSFTKSPDNNSGYFEIPAGYNATAKQLLTKFPNQDGGFAGCSPSSYLFTNIVSKNDYGSDCYGLIENSGSVDFKFAFIDLNGDISADKGVYIRQARSSDYLEVGDDQFMFAPELAAAPLFKMTVSYSDAHSINTFYINITQCNSSTIGIGTQPTVCRNEPSDQIYNCPAAFTGATCSPMSNSKWSDTLPTK